MGLKINAHDILKSLREARGFSQGEAAKQLGRTGAWLSNLENSSRKLSANDLGDLADLYDVDASIFFESQCSAAMVGLSIDKALREQNISAKKLADDLNLNYFRIAKCISGEVDLTAEEVQSIGDYLHIDQPPFSDPIKFDISRIVSIASNLGIPKDKLEMLKTFIEDEVSEKK